MILAIDPGRAKCGVAVVNRQQSTIMKEIITSEAILARILSLKQKYNIENIILGNGTGSEKIKKTIEKINLTMMMIDETNSTLEAKKLYWHENPPQGWKKLIPMGLLIPKRPIDDYAAVVLARKHLKLTGF